MGFNDIIQVFQKEYNQNITKMTYYRWKTQDQQYNYKAFYKLRFHVIITPKHANLMYKTNVKFGESSAYHVYSSLLKQDEEYYKNKLDNAVYKRDGAFRCIGSFKNRDDVSCLH